MAWLKIILAAVLLGSFYCLIMRYNYQEKTFKDVRKWSIIRVIVLPLWLLAESMPWLSVLGSLIAMMIAELASWIYWKRLQGKNP
jgi:hypothetical protein